MPLPKSRTLFFTEHHPQTSLFSNPSQDGAKVVHMENTVTDYTKNFRVLTTVNLFCFTQYGKPQLCLINTKMFTKLISKKEKSFNLRYTFIMQPQIGDEITKTFIQHQISKFKVAGGGVAMCKVRSRWGSLVYKISSFPTQNQHQSGIIQIYVG